MRGDAGTGKTTYIHYLKWKFTDVNWKIIDLQRANKKITVMGHRIKFSNFFSLHGKVISAVLNKVISAIFLTQNDMSPDIYKEISSNIQFLLCMYDKCIHHMGPLDEYDLLYRTLGNLPAPVDGEELDYCKHCAKLVTEYFMKMCVMNSDVEDALECAIVHYLIVLRCLRGSKKTVIVFDNLERFIGVHEIFSNELIDFVANLRTIVDTYKDQYFDSIGNRNRFAENCQLIVSMRNTSARNFTPLQNADFFESSIDLSEWFSMGEILQRKLTWFEKEKIEVENSIILKHILGDFGVARGGVVRGLRPKLNLIFNFDKRLMTDFLIETLEASANKNIIEIADTLRTKTFSGNGADDGLGAFSYRSIIWRLVMDKLNRGAMFRYIFAKRNSALDSYVDMDYTRNILTILSNYELEHRDQEYMPLEDLVHHLEHNMIGNVDNWFDNQTWKTEREKVTQLLYYMNYFNRRALNEQI